MSGAFGLVFEGREPPAVTLPLIEAADRGGIVTLWVACHLFQREPIALATLALARTERMTAALMAMSPYSMHPVYPPMAAATMEELFPGRVVLCLGVGAPGDLAAAGIAAPQPLATMREAVAIARGMHAGELMDHAGQRFQVKGRRMETATRSVPLVLAASGPRMLRLAGEIADGVLISTATSVEFVRWCLDLVDQGAKGRKVKKIGLVHVAIADDPAAAAARHKRLMAFILRGAHHRRNLEMAGSTLDQAAINAAIARDDWAGAAALVSDEVVRRHTASGTPEEVRARLAAYRAAGLDEIAIGGVRTAAELEQVLAVVR
jgi:5,10-methylenetetrahydromethanopterin reductase